MSGMSRAREVAKFLVERRRGDLAQVQFTERGHRLTAWCPKDEIFTLVRELLLDRVYERSEVSLQENIGVVIDAGAHVGIFSLQAAQWATSVVALEPSRINFDLLRLNLDRNRVANVDARHLALWPRSEEALVFREMGHSGGGTVAPLRDGPDLSGSSPVGGISLDELIEEFATVDLLKIDIEGAEFDCLSMSKRLGAVRQIVGEIHLVTAADTDRLEHLLVYLCDVGFTTAVVPEHEFYSTSRARRLMANRARLSGYPLIKALVASYYLAPITKPIRTAGQSYSLPVLFAWREGAQTVRTEPPWV